MYTERERRSEDSFEFLNGTNIWPYTTETKYTDRVSMSAYSGSSSTGRLIKMFASIPGSFREEGREWVMWEFEDGIMVSDSIILKKLN